MNKKELKTVHIRVNRDTAAYFKTLGKYNALKSMPKIMDLVKRYLEASFPSIRTDVKWKAGRK